MNDTLLHQLQAAVGASYEIQRELGGGGMSRVFLASETQLGRMVVIKVLFKDGEGERLSDRFSREVRFAARLQQANIVPLLSAGSAVDFAFYVMPFVEGLSLRSRLEDRNSMPLEEATHILRDVAKALAYAHEHGVIHRDIKPENVLLSAGTAVVTDFGIAKALSNAAPGSSAEQSAFDTTSELTLVGSSLGTPAYMSPEQALGAAVDARSDLYAWGVMAYELLAGAHPFAGRKTRQAMVAAHITKVPEPLSSRAPRVSPALDALVMSCMAKDPDQRPESGRALVSALVRMEAESTGSRTNVQVLSQTLTDQRGARLLGAIAAFLVLMGGAWGWQTREPISKPALVSDVLLDDSRKEALARRINLDSTVVGRIAILPPVNHTGNPKHDSLFFELLEATHRGLLGSLTSAVSKPEMARFAKEVGLRSNALPQLEQVSAVLRRTGASLAIQPQLSLAPNGIRVHHTFYRSFAHTERATNRGANIEELTSVYFDSRGPDGFRAIWATLGPLQAFTQSLESCSPAFHKEKDTAPWCWSTGRNLDVVSQLGER